MNCLGIRPLTIEIFEHETLFAALFVILSKDFKSTLDVSELSRTTRLLFVLVVEGRRNKLAFRDTILSVHRLFTSSLYSRLIRST